LLEHSASVNRNALIRRIFLSAIKLQQQQIFTICSINQPD